MERPSRPFELTLVTKYNSITNYSYPRPESAVPHSAASSHFRFERTSLGSEGSAPGLVDDRSDSEASVDDDFQYHAHGAEIWDSFWQDDQSSIDDRSSKDTKQHATVHPTEQYPALIPSPHRKKRQPVIGNTRPNPSWPLPSSPPQGERKPAAMYSPFPQAQAKPKPAARAQPSYRLTPFPTTTPTTRTTPAHPSTLIPRPASSSKPKRPARPDDKLLTPCIQQRATAPPALVFSDVPFKLDTHQRRPSSPSIECQRPRMSLNQPRPSFSLERGPAKPLRSSNPVYPLSAACYSSTQLAQTQVYQNKLHQGPRSYKSTPHMAALAVTQTQLEPHSVFEIDDSEGEDAESHALSIFRFHKRSDSESHRRSKKIEDNNELNAAQAAWRRRKRANTAPSSPSRHPEKPKKQGDVLGRMLGRRSRA